MTTHYRRRDREGLVLEEEGEGGVGPLPNVNNEPGGMQRAVSAIVSTDGMSQWTVDYM